MNQPQKKTVDTNLSYLMLRSLLGIIALLLPILLYVFNGNQLKSSISHFYYSSSSVLFIGSLFAFGLFLISYRGREKESRISDNTITNIAGVLAIIVAIIPTAFCHSPECSLQIASKLGECCDGESLTTQWIHNNQTMNTIHLVSAGLFMINMGIMSFFRFTKNPKSQTYLWFYRTCGLLIWASILIMMIGIFFNLNVFDHFIFTFETIALMVFGISWLVKGKPTQIIRSHFG